MSNLAKIFVFLFVRVITAKTHCCYNTTNSIEETIHMAMDGKGLRWTVLTKTNEYMTVVARKDEDIVLILNWQRGGKPSVTFCNPIGMDIVSRLQEKTEKAFANGLKAVHHLDGFIFTKPSWKGGDICLHSGSYWKPECYDGDSFEDDYDTMGEAIRAMDAHYAQI